MPINRVAELMRVNPQRIWTVFKHWIGQALKADKSVRHYPPRYRRNFDTQGHHYVTLGVDMDAGRVIHVSEGKGKTCILAIREHLSTKGVAPAQIRQASMDLSPAFIAGVKQAFPKAQITFDRFHVVKLLNEAMDCVRKAERKEYEALKGHKYTFLKNPNTLSNGQQ